MTNTDAGLVAGAAELALVILTLAMALAFVRLVRGPSLPDRVVALELMTAIAVGFICAYSIRIRSVVLLDAATVLALISFLATVAFAKYIEKGGVSWRQRPQS